MANENQKTAIVRYDKNFAYSQRDVQKVEVSPIGFLSSYAFFDVPPGSGKSAFFKHYEEVINDALSARFLDRLNRTPITVEAREASPSAEAEKVEVKQTPFGKSAFPFVDNPGKIKVQSQYMGESPHQKLDKIILGFSQDLNSDFF